MKIVDAYWEKANLGVTSISVTVEAEDSLLDIRRTVGELAAQYNVVKVPAGRSDVMLCLSELGFAFVEGSIHVTKAVKDAMLPKIQQRLTDCVSYSAMTDEDIERLWLEIQGGIFDTDRIYLDPHFSRSQAADRYVNWIRSEYSNGAEIYKLTYKEESIGFFTLKDLGGGVYYPFLAGMYASEQNSGLGINIAYKPICEVGAKGGKLISTYISTNNEKTIRLHVNLGFTFNQVVYVFVKHIGIPYVSN